MSDDHVERYVESCVPTGKHVNQELAAAMLSLFPQVLGNFRVEPNGPAGWVRSGTSGALLDILRRNFGGLYTRDVLR